MSNPVVLITSGLTGIGRAAAIAFAKKGAKDSHQTAPTQFVEANGIRFATASPHDANR